MARKTVNLSEKDLAALEKLKDAFDAISLNDTIRRSIAQASVLNDLTDETGAIEIVDSDGTRRRLQIKPAQG